MYFLGLYLTTLSEDPDSITEMFKGTNVFLVGGLKQNGCAPKWVLFEETFQKWVLIPDEEKESE